MHDTFMWLKALHIIAIVSWMAGMFYLPRLFVYHTQVAVGSEASEIFKVMERKLLRFIINPAMIATWALGIALAVKIHAFEPGNGHWLDVKLAFVLLMQLAHAYMARCRRAFAQERGFSACLTKCRRC
jgi:putative membrane protein